MTDPMTTRPSRASIRGARRLDLWGLTLLLVGLVCGALAYRLVTTHGANPLVLVPAVVAATTGATHLTKRVTAREGDDHA